MKFYIGHPLSLKMVSHGGKFGLVMLTSGSYPEVGVLWVKPRKISD